MDTNDFIQWAAYLLAAYFVGFFVRKIWKNVARFMSGSYYDG